MIGCGGIGLANHLPGIEMCNGTRLVALCDPNEAALAAAKEKTGVEITATDYNDIMSRDDVHAVIIATPNIFHAPITLAAAKARKHVLCEKPLALNLAEAQIMLNAVEEAKVKHMTAFTYRFVPGMNYMSQMIQKGMIGEPFHFRVQRFQDWGTRNIGWRQNSKMAGSGELGDMLSHRLDFAHMLVGPFKRLVAQTKIYHPEREGKPNDLEDWVSVIAEFENGCTGVLESTKVATGRGEGGQSQDYCEVNGSEGTMVYMVNRPNEVQIGKKGSKTLETMTVPDEFLTWKESPRDPSVGDPVQTFRYDQDWEFIDAIQKDRKCTPSFHEGIAAQRVMEGILKSAEEERWINMADL